MIINPSKLSGRIAIPPSKSQTMRALLFALMARGESHLFNTLCSPDVEAMMAACRMLGARIGLDGDLIRVTGVGGRPKVPEDVIGAGNSGLVLRFMGAIAALCPGWTVITGDASIRFNRQARPLLEGIEQLGGTAFSTKGDGRAPIAIKGPLRGGKAVISGEDSQPVSGLLMAACFIEAKTELSVLDAGEKPWVGLTLSWFDRLGLPYENENFERYRIDGGARYEGFEYHVPGDFSSAAFPLAAALITDSELVLEGLDLDEPQGDKKLIEILRRMGALIETGETCRIKRGSTLYGIEVDLNDCIDALPILAVLGCHAEGKTVIRGAQIARQKECDRIQSTVQELRKMGADISETDDGLEVSRSPLTGAELDSHQDHRLAMALACAGLGASGASRIHDVRCIDKSFPGFVREFQRLGAKFEP